MNFQGLRKVESDRFYFGVALNRCKKKADAMRQQKNKGNPLQKSKMIELIKLETFEVELGDQLMNVLKSYPSFDNLSEFYKELIKTTIDLGYLKKSLAALGWCAKKSRDFLRIYKSKIRMSTELPKINGYRREYFGRVGSALKQIKPHLIYLEMARKTMKAYPSIKTSMPTIALVGFPNVGKTTLLSKITPSKPKIAAYAFTTVGINQGFEIYNKQKTQFLDTPGTLARFDKQNVVEQIATLAIKYLAEGMIYVFDPTETYTLKKQIELYDLTKKHRKPMLIYISKTDIADKKDIDKIKKLYKDAITDVKVLKKELNKMELI